MVSEAMKFAGKGTGVVNEIQRSVEQELERHGIKKESSDAEEDETETDLEEGN
jgi:hypothetical protein